VNPLPARRRGTAAALATAVVAIAFPAPAAEAASLVGTLQAETMTLGTGQSVVSDGSAGAGQAVKLVSGQATGVLYAAGSVSSVTIRARGVRCGSAYPIAEVSVDGQRVFARTVSSSGWTSYSTSVNLTSGAHQVGVTFTNPAARSSCTRTLYADWIQAVGTPQPPRIYWGARMDGDVYNRSGDAPWDSGTWNLFEQHARKKVSIVHFGQPAPWNQQFYPSPLQLTYARGAIPLVTMDTHTALLTDIANGAYDESIAAWADGAKAFGKPFFLRWDWEMNGDWYPWGAQARQDPAAYVAAWRHFHDVVTAREATNVTWTWCPNIVFEGSTPLTDLYPGDGYVDWTCMDGYNWGTNPFKPGGWGSFTEIFQQTYAEIDALAPGKPLMIAETASSEYGGSKSLWISSALGTELPVAFPNIKAFVWFNWNVWEGGGRLDWPIESSASAQSAFAAAIASPYYTTNTFANLPPLTKVPSP
jgi:Ca-dependent carbohydrate-binding module xylan-binding/Glycosyl hydrolase family 26